MFNRWETEFANRIFHPYQVGDRSTFDYESWLLRFATSVAWRVGVTSLAATLNVFPHHAAAAETALATWQSFLRSKLPTVRPYRPNLFFQREWDPRGLFDLPPMAHFYLQLGVDCTWSATAETLAVYFHLPGMAFWYSVLPPDPGGWRGTLIKNRGTIRAAGQRVESEDFQLLLLERMRFVTATALSPAQQRLLDDLLSADPERAARSASYRAFLTDEKYRRK